MTTTPAFADADLPLQSLYKWEQEKGKQRFMSQPSGNGQYRDYAWAEAVDAARRLAAHLQSHGFEPGSSIATLTKNCAEFILTELAIWMAGYRTVALYPTVTAETVRYVLDHSDARLLFVGKLDTWEDMKSGIPDDMPCIAYSLAPPTDYPKLDDILADTEPIDGRPTRGVDETAMLIYTSGSTGKPKGVDITFKNIAIYIKGSADIIKPQPDERVLSYLPMAHAFERALVESGTLVSGGQIFFAESLDTFQADLQRAQPTIFGSVPRLWLKFQLGVFQGVPEKKLDRLLKIPILGGLVRKKILTALGLQHCRIAVSGSAPIPKEVIEWYRKLGLDLLEGYGMTENFAYSHWNPPGEGRVGTVGKALPGVECRISDEGEVQVKSEALMRGYYKQPEETRASFTDDGFLKTGDRGSIDADGYLTITGRVKELFKTSKGKYVAPAPIENILNVSPIIELSCVAGSGQPACHGLVLIAEDLRPDARKPENQAKLTAQLENLLLHANANVDPHEQMQFLVVVKDEWSIENGFLTPTMKIKRNVLEDRYSRDLDAWYNSGERIIWET